MSENQVVETQVTETPASEELPIEMQAAQYLQGAIPVVCNEIENLNGKQAKAILKKLMRTPLEDDNYQFTSEHAGKVYQVCGLIQNAKFVLFTASAKDSANIEEAMQQGEAQAESNQTAEESSAKE